MRNTFLFTYDISNDLRLRRVHKTMCGFGDHLQYSVFECQFSQTDLVRCRHALGKLIHHQDDQVLFAHTSWLVDLQHELSMTMVAQETLRPIG